jgi:hypothetical protein
VKIELRGIARRNAVSTFKLYSEKCANTGSPQRLDVCDLSEQQ